MRKMVNNMAEGTDHCLHPADLPCTPTASHAVDVPAFEGPEDEVKKLQKPRGPALSTMTITSGFDELPRTWKFFLLAAGLFSFFGIHNLFQEFIMHLPNFRYGWFLGFLEVLGVTVFSGWERRMANETGRRASLKAYASITLCLMGSSSLSNISLNYINYPTKVVFRSCKLIPTMVIAGCINKRSFSAVEYAAALAVSLGLIVFGYADFSVSPKFDPWGLTLVSLSVVCDAILPNLQEKLFSTGASRLEVTFYSNVFTLATMAGSMLISGDLVGATLFAARSRGVITYMVLYTVLAYVAISLHMQMLRTFGSVITVLVGSTRKAMTIVLSFLIFPKPFTVEYALGGLFVLAGLIVSACVKQRSKR